MSVHDALNWAGGRPKKRGFEDDENDQFQIRGLGQQQQDDRARHPREDHHRSPLRDDGSIHPSRTHLLADLPTPTTRARPDYPLSPRSKSSESTADTATSKMSHPISSGQQHFHTADDTSQDPRPQRVRKNLRIETAPSQHPQTRRSSEHTPSDLPADMSRSRDPRRSQTEWAPQFGGDSYRPEYSRRKTEYSMEHAMSTPRSPIDTPGSAGPRTARSERYNTVPPRMTSGSPVDATGSSIHQTSRSPLETSSRVNTEPRAEQQAQPTPLAVVPKQPLIQDVAPTPKVDVFQQLNALADTIKQSASAAMRGDRSRQEYEVRADIYKKNMKHKDTFPTLFEDTEFKASRAEEMLMAIDSESDLAQKTQEGAAAKLALTLQMLQPMHTSLTDDHDDAEIASLRKDLQLAQEGLDQARCDIDLLNRDTVTNEQLSTRVQQAKFKGAVSWRSYDALEDKVHDLRKVHDAHETNLADLKLDLHNHKTELANVSKVAEVAKNIPSDIQQMRRDIAKMQILGEKQDTKFGIIKDDISKEREVAKQDVLTLEKKIAKFDSIIKNLQASIGRLEESRGVREEKVVALQNDVKQLRDGLEDIRTMMKPTEVTKINAAPEGDKAPTSQNGQQELQKFLEVNLETTLQTIKDEQATFHDIFMAEAERTSNVMEQHTNAIAKLKAELSMCQSDVQKMAANMLLQQPSEATADSGADSGNADLKQLGDKTRELENKLKAIEVFVAAQQQKFDGLTTTQLTHNMVNSMAQMYPAHPAHIANQLNRLTQSCQAAEGALQLLSSKYSEIERAVKNGADPAYQQIKKRVDDLSSSLATLRGDVMATSEEVKQLREGSVNAKEDVSHLRSNVNGLAVEITRLSNRPGVASLTPPSMGSRVPSISTGIGPQEVEGAQGAADSDSDPAFHIHNQSALRATIANIHSNGKRQREVSNSGGDDGPPATGAKKAHKQIRRMNKSRGGE